VNRILALDYGQRRIGVAISDPLGLTAQPLETWHYLNWDEVVRNILNLIFSKGVQRVIVGLPLTMKGETGKMARETERFVKKLHQNLSVPIELWDERLTSVQAKRTLLHSSRAVRRKRSNVDTLAAVLLLQNYLDRQEIKNKPAAEEKG